MQILEQVRLGNHQEIKEHCNMKIITVRVVNVSKPGVVVSVRDTKHQSSRCQVIDFTPNAAHNTETVGTYRVRMLEPSSESKHKVGDTVTITFNLDGGAGALFRFMKLSMSEEASSKQLTLTDESNKVWLTTQSLDVAKLVMKCINV